MCAEIGASKISQGAYFNASDRGSLKLDFLKSSTRLTQLFGERGREVVARRTQQKKTFVEAAFPQPGERGSLRDRVPEVGGGAGIMH